MNVGKGTTGPQTVRTFEEAKKIAKTYPGGKLLLKAGASERDILKFVADKISQEKRGLGGKKGFPVGTTKENKMWRNFYNSALKENGRMQLITEIPRDSDGNINWKIKDKDGVNDKIDKLGNFQAQFQSKLGCYPFRLPLIVLLKS